ncbi:MAG: extracellular solute-binding protein [Alphaproteobacteria bacterium]|nr:extracellular solute-binding protein [Alphaproteobacteria bacterium]
MQLTRREFVGTALGTAAAATWPQSASAQLAMPASPVVLNIVDVAGDLALTQTAIENYRNANPNRVSNIIFSKGLQPELPGKLKAQQDAKRVDMDLILCGYDGMTGGIDQGLWIELVPTYAQMLPKLDEIYLEGARKIQEQSKGQGVCVTYSPYGGGLFTYNPDHVKKVPTTAQELMDWAKQNKDKFMYSRPANSGPGRAFITGLPYMLGDSKPTDPEKGWDKTWSYLKAIHEYIEYYPAGTAATMKEFGEGTRDIVPVSLGFDINSRALGIVPKEAKTFTLKDFHWLVDGHFMCVPKGVSNDKLAVILDLMKHMLTPKQQAYIYDKGYNYPGPAVKGVTLDMAPKESQDTIAEFGRPEYAALIENNPQEVPLTPQATVAAFRIWDETIAGSKRRQ